MVYAIIYSLFLGFGITVGTVLYGLFDRHATTATSCTDPLPPYYRFFFVPLFTFCLAFVNQAKWQQMPVQVIIAFAGYIVNFFTGRRIGGAPQIANTLGALTVGVLANLYSRVRHGVAAAALLPAIFVQVPSGLAATGSLLSGLQTANMVTNSSTPINGTDTVSVLFSSLYCLLFLNCADRRGEIGRTSRRLEYRGPGRYGVQRGGNHDTDCHWHHGGPVPERAHNLSTRETEKRALYPLIWRSDAS